MRADIERESLEFMQLCSVLKRSSRTMMEPGKSALRRVHAFGSGDEDCASIMEIPLVYYVVGLASKRCRFSM